MTFVPPETFAAPVQRHLPTQRCAQCWHDLFGACGWCCMRCSFNRHQCNMCEQHVRHDGKELDGSEHPCG